MMIMEKLKKWVREILGNFWGGGISSNSTLPKTQDKSTQNWVENISQTPWVQHKTLKRPAHAFYHHFRTKPWIFEAGILDEMNWCLCGDQPLVRPFVYHWDLIINILSHTELDKLTDSLQFVIAIKMLLFIMIAK